MKKVVATIVAIAVMSVAAVGMAATYNGSYTFKERIKEGKSDMQGWNGTMTIQEKEMVRNYSSPDGKENKYYTSRLTEKTKDGTVVTVKHIKAYKQEYVGNEFDNKITQNGSNLIIESVDGKFKETWVKK